MIVVVVVFKNPSPTQRWEICLQLTNIRVETGTNQRKIYCGLILNETCKNFWIMVMLRPMASTLRGRFERVTDRVTFTLIYTVLK